ncbi:hypothetical protein CEUSTIGMA_g3381.t1 [Chlamydomonas eustigma]|uniref:Selenoprotein O n=1 Tax=Chlamydomonas eustigma TaxID=1157962 RepID=A0A250WYL8_9CHLO|nr:hypothetical protein CEUSTIGMA_g3381.t1 [Chlamydomonas eustigma]|eukprot:GAX75938.1 hypothetical protein CEUSTIGMA_g3381.t1 [Chlamydomonas eustigma]
MTNHLIFDNQILRCLPFDEASKDVLESRLVRNACFCSVQLQPLESPIIISCSEESLELLDVTPEVVLSPSFASQMSGSSLIPSSQPAAHCYAGHQFGNFSGQLGDGAAMYLGEVINLRGQRWELQLKGAGRTPFSRAGDGRKVLRSSLREFLCSEAMYHLGIPTTRAATLVVSDTRVERDPFYDGKPVMERCAVVSRLAPTFLRFGSFEIFKEKDVYTGREGPSRGLEHELLPKMVNFTIQTYFPDIWTSHNGDQLIHTSNIQGIQDMYLDWFKEVLRRTASLAVGWQSVGFCHGVLNTDNMSIIGLTLDYGPFGFMERYSPDVVPNGSDDAGRYDFKGQREVCRWNCVKLGEALSPVLPERLTRGVLHEAYDDVYDRLYISLMRKKLGLLKRQEEEDLHLVTDILEAMHQTGSDFTNTFRQLSSIPLPSKNVSLTADSNGGPEAGSASTALLSTIMAHRATKEELVRMADSRMPSANLQMLMLLLHRDPALLHALGTNPQAIARDIERHKRAEEIASTCEDVRLEQDTRIWTSWLQKYEERLRREAEAGAINRERVQVMNATNPRFVLRNWLAQHAIDLAEKGDFMEVNRLLELLKSPFTEDDHDTVVEKADARIHPVLIAKPTWPEAEGYERTQGSSIRYDDLAPANKVCNLVTCSS